MVSIFEQRLRAAQTGPYFPNFFKGIQQLLSNIFAMRIFFVLYRITYSSWTYRAFQFHVNAEVAGSTSCQV